MRSNVLKVFLVGLAIGSGHAGGDRPALVAGEVFSRLPTNEYRLAQSPDVERRIAEQKRKAEQRRKEFDTKVQRLKAEHARRVEEFKRNGSRTKAGSSNTAASGRRLPRSPLTTKPTAPPFDAADAASPEDCINAFMKAARSANSMNDLIGYLPTAEQATLRVRQANYDPVRAASRRAKYRQEGKLEEDSIAWLTNSPYANALHHYRSIAEKFIQVQRVKVAGNKATVTVSTHSDAIVDGKRYPYGTATIDMVGEGRLWRIDKYNDSPVVYLHPPARKRDKEAEEK